MTIRYEIHRQVDTRGLTFGPWRVDEWEVCKDFDGREREVWISSRYYTTEREIQEAVFRFQQVSEGVK